MYDECTDGQWVAYQRSVWNYHTADLAIDNSTSTCYISGHDIGAWWFVDLGLQRVVDAVTISGALILPSRLLPSCIQVATKVTRTLSTVNRRCT